MNIQLLLNIQLLISGLSSGIIYGLIAMGMVMIFRTVGVMNFAQGEFLMVGGYLCYTFNRLLNWSIGFALLASAVLMGLLGVVFMLTSYWPLRQAQPRAIIVSAMGASMFMKEGAQLVWGPLPVTIDRVVDGVVNVFGARVQSQNLAIIVCAVACMMFVYILLEKTFIGHIMQATAQDQYMSSMVGVPVVASIGMTFALSAVMTGIGGGLLAPLFFLTSSMGVTAGAKAFAAIVIGGFGSVTGAIVGGFIVGLVEAFGGAYISTTYQLVLIYIVLILMLMLRPQGLFGTKIHDKA